jgi:Ca2+-binding EF-hand superfamily protein
MRFRVLALALPLLLPSRPAAAAEAPRPIPGDEQSLVFLHAARPLLVRLHVQIDGQPFRTRWDDALRALFAYLDTNGDGALSKEEMSRAPSPAQLGQLLQGTLAVEPDAAPGFAEVDRDPADGRVTLPELQAFYRRAGVGPLHLQINPRQEGADLRSAALFHYLDRDKDGNLAREELLAAPASLRPLDLNEDELIDTSELFSGPAGTRFGSPAPPADAAPAGASFFLLHPTDPPGPLVQRLLARYDRDKDGKLSRAEIALDRAAFDRLDANHDGQLDAAELARWGQGPPDLELMVQLGQARDRDGKTVVLGSAERARPALSSIRPDLRGALVIALPDTQIDLWRGEPVSPGARRGQSPLRARFRALDANGDGYLDSREVFREPFDLVALLRLADRDGDGRVSAKEFAAFVEFQERAAAVTTLLTVTDHGRSLFAMLDADRDERLGPRELRGAWARLAPWDRDGDGRIAPAEVPRQFQMVISQARVQPAASGPGLERPFDRPRVERTRGPVWFRKMDRNHDGDVSPAEFLGSPEDFRRIDADGDGLIDVDEAERADGWFRQHRGPGSPPPAPADHRR